jgi:hypothetical protein
MVSNALIFVFASMTLGYSHATVILYKCTMSYLVTF